MMRLSAYLAKYGRDKRRLLNWVAANGCSTSVALKLLKYYASKDHNFQDGGQLDRSLLQTTYTQQKERDESLSKMNFWGKLKWLLTKKQ